MVAERQGKQAQRNACARLMSMVAIRRSADWTRRALDNGGWGSLVHHSGVNRCKQRDSHMRSAVQEESAEKGSRRLSVSLTPEQHAELLEIAKKNKVSIAWVVREAIERLLRDELPLFRPRQPK